MTKFGRDIKKYDGIEKKKAGVMIYVINTKSVIDYLKKEKFYEIVEEIDIDPDELTTIL